MPAITPAYQIVSPSYIMPEMILSYQQASGAFSVMASGNPLVRLADGDQYVYMKRLDIRTQVTSSRRHTCSAPAPFTIITIWPQPETGGLRFLKPSASAPGRLFSSNCEMQGFTV